MNQQEIQHRFFVASVIGVLVLVFVFLYLFVRPSFCQIQRNEWVADTYQYSYPSYYGAEERGHIIARKNIDSPNKTGATYKKYEENALDIACGEIKITDLALVFFTYFLVVVGWFTLRSSEETSITIERPYLFVSIEGDLTPSKRKGFETVRHANIVIKNYGRTPAILEDFGFSVSKEKGFPKSLNSDQGTSIPQGLVIGQDQPFPTGTPFMLTPEELAQVEDMTIKLVCYGFIVYLDAFNRRHETYFGWQWYPHSNRWGIAGNHDLNKYT